MAGTSLLKTHLLHVDRVTDRHHGARLLVCESCPGGHARYKKDGSLHTCGPMFVSLTREGVPTCGCVLTRKARDLKQACPFGYWETVDAQAAQESITPVAVATRVGTGLSTLLFSRRGLIGTGLVGFAGYLGLAARPGRVLATDKPGDQCYVSVGGCGRGVGNYVKCTKVEGWTVGQVFEGKADEDEGPNNRCYEILDSTPKLKNEFHGHEVTTVASKKTDTGCEDGCGSCTAICDDPCDLNNEDVPSVAVTINWSDSSQVPGINDPDGVPNSDDETVNAFGYTFSNGETKNVCPTTYSCIAFQTVYFAFRDEIWEREQSLRLVADGTALTGYTSGFFRWGSGVRVEGDSFLGIWGRSYAYYATPAVHTSSLNGYDIDPNAFPEDAKIGGEHFGSITTTSGVKISWSRGGGPWGC